MNLAIIGGGNLAHAIAVSASLFFGKVSVLATGHESWAKKLTAVFPGNEIVTSKDIVCSNDPETIIKDADAILFTVPSHIIPSKLIMVKPYLKKDSIIGSIIASGGFFWIARSILGTDLPLFAFQRVPFICRIQEKGRSVSVTGTKNELFVANHFSKDSSDKYYKMVELFEKSFRSRIIQLESYLEVTISNSNPILHTTRLYTLIQKPVTETPLLFYRTWDDDTSNMLLSCDNEVFDIIHRIPLQFPLFKSLKEHYGVTNGSELTKKLSSIDAFKSITFPVLKKKEGVFMPDPNNRYFQEDLAFGLVILKALAVTLKVNTPVMDSVIKCLQQYIGKCYISRDGSLDGTDLAFSGVPQNYGFTTMNNILNLIPDTQKR